MRLTSTALLLFPALLGACASMPDDAAGVTPQRPSFSSDTSTTAPGTFELEAGATLDPGDSAAVPMALKYGVGERTEVYVGLSPYQVLERPGEDGEGLGDTLLGLRHRFWESEADTSAALQLSTKLPTGDDDEGLSSGEYDLFAAGILTHAFDERSALTAYYELGFLGDPASSDVDDQHAFALALSRTLPSNYGTFFELAEVFGPHDVDPIVATLGVTKALSRSVVFDVGLALGLNDDAPDVQLLVGFTVNFGALGIR